MSLLVRRWERTIVINNSAVEKKYRLTCFSRMNTIMKRTKVCIGFISIFIITMYLVVALTGCGKDKSEFVGKGLVIGNSAESVKKMFPATMEYSTQNIGSQGDRVFYGNYHDMPFMAVMFRDIDTVQWIVLENISSDYDLNEILSIILPDDVVEISASEALKIAASTGNITNSSKEIDFTWERSEKKNDLHDYCLYSEKFKQVDPSSSGVIFIDCRDDTDNSGKKRMYITGCITLEYSKKYKEEKKNKNFTKMNGKKK